MKKVPSDDWALCAGKKRITALPKPETVRATKNEHTLRANAQSPYSAGRNSLVRIGVVIKDVRAGRSCESEYLAISFMNLLNTFHLESALKS